MAAMHLNKDEEHVHVELLIPSQRGRDRESEDHSSFSTAAVPYAHSCLKGNREECGLH